MRVSESIKYQTAKNDLQKSSQDISDLAKKISSGKRVSKSSDDPAAFVQAERLKSSIRDMQKTRENLFFAKNWLDQADQNTESMLNILQEIKIKALNAANSYVSVEQLSSINNEIDTLRDRLLALGNSKIDKTHLFAGSATLNPPLSENPPEHESTLFYPYPRYRTFQVFDSSELEQTVENVRPNSIITVHYEDVDTGAESEVIVPVQPEDTYYQVMARINERMAAEHFMKNDPASQTGFRQDLYVSHGVDGHIYMDLSENIRLKDLNFPPELKRVFEFSIVENTFGQNEDIYDQKPVAKGLGSPYGEYFTGYAEKSFVVRIVKPGFLESAQYIVSDDFGETWSKPEKLSLENQVVTDASLSGNEIELVFDPKAKNIFFPMNLEFHSKPFSIVSYEGNLDKREIPIGDGDRLQTNINAHGIFFSQDIDSGRNVFDTIFQLQRSIDQEQFDRVSKLAGDLDIAINQILEQRAVIGNSLNKLKAFEIHSEKNEISKHENLSELEDLDMPEAITRLKQKEAHNQVAMSATSKLLQPSLVNFLR